MKLKPHQKRSWADIDLDAAKHDYHTTKNQLSKGTKLCCVVKVNGNEHVPRVCKENNNVDTVVDSIV